MANEQRLIDANAIPYEEHYVPNGDVQWGYKKELCVLKPTVDAMPTVDAVEVVYAHWEDGCAIHNGKEVYKSIDCSHCNEIFKTEDREYWKKRFKRCPFCGAMMDGGNEDDNKAST